MHLNAKRSLGLDSAWDCGVPACLTSACAVSSSEAGRLLLLSPLSLPLPLPSSPSLSTPLLLRLPPVQQLVQKHEKSLKKRLNFQQRNKLPPTQQVCTGHAKHGPMVSLVHVSVHRRRKEGKKVENKPTVASGPCKHLPTCTSQRRSTSVARPHHVPYEPPLPSTRPPDASTPSPIPSHFIQSMPSPPSLYCLGGGGGGKAMGGRHQAVARKETVTLQRRVQGVGGGTGTGSCRRGDGQGRTGTPPTCNPQGTSAA